ncbi:MAG: NAD-dependent deacetylase [Oligosphaeraceae bacterium]|nr:NAD-dependent deacetylase [Oligosphaeraceae bacterium]
MQEQKLHELLTLLRQAKKCLAFTGAGVSTLSGVPDFRGPQGVHAQRVGDWTVEELHDIEVFRRHPDVFYAYAKNSWYQLDNLPANVVHLTLARLEEMGLLQAVYTQNIDMLHQKGGSRRVEEIHGTMATHSCLECGAKYGFAEIKRTVLEDQVPYCIHCRGLVKPDVVFFGEMLDQGLLNRSVRDFNEADLVLALGSSLTVQPAANMPMLTLQAKGKLVIVNSQPTQYDRFATLKFDDLAEVFEFLEKNL